MKTFAAIAALTAILLVGVHTAFAAAVDFEGRDQNAPAALYLPGADETTQIVSDGRIDTAGALNA
jgi:hypothetical protein